MPMSVAAPPWANKAERAANEKQAEMFAASQKLREPAIPVWAWMVGFLVTVAILVLLAAS